MDNRTIAERLTGFARYLESRRKSLYRVSAYRRAAETILNLDRAAEDIVAERGRKGLEALPGIGPQIAFAICSLVQTGVFHTLRKKSRREPRPALAVASAGPSLFK